MAHALYDYAHKPNQKEVNNSENPDNTRDCHTRPQLNSSEIILKQAILNNIRSRNKKQKTPNKIQNSHKSPTSINKILRQSPKAKSIKKPNKSKVKSIVREFEGKIAHDNRNISPLKKDRNYRACGKGTNKRNEVQSSQADIRIFLERRIEGDISPKRLSK